MSLLVSGMHCHPFHISYCSSTNFHDGALLTQRRCQNLALMRFVGFVQFKFFVDLAAQYPSRPYLMGF